MYFQQNLPSLKEQLQLLKDHFQSGATKTYQFRKQQLINLKKSVLKYENELYDALYKDLKKSKEESWVTELGFLISEINATLKRLHRWMEWQKVKTNLLNFPSSSYIVNEPLGVVLIIGPWNYPLQLLFTPLVGAIAAGNCVVLKPSEFAPATSNIMERIINETFPKEYILYVQGDGAEVVPAMMNNFKFDHVFYTGSTAVGKIIYKLAAEKLVPVTLELGGKSPCVIEEDADIKVAARRIAVTKFSNAGQMCVAPDYILVHNNIKDTFIVELKQTLVKFFSDEPANNDSYGKIINEKQFIRLSQYLKDVKIIHGGKTNKEKLVIDPVIVEAELSSALMHGEIFGPIIPIISFSSFNEAKKIINENPDPLAFYIFSSSKGKQKFWIDNIPAGGACINNASWHLTNHHLPFGGRGDSGIGNYHGRYSFDTFSHKKAVMRTPTWFDPDIKYPPFKGKLSLFKKIIR